MTRRRIAFTVAACCLVGACPIVTSAATVLFDDFSDGQPVANWASNGQLTFENDSMRIQGIGGIWSEPNPLNLQDTSIRTRVRLLEGGTISIDVREPPGNPTQNYNGFLSQTLDEAGISIITGPDMGEVLEAVPLELDITNNDVMMQLDVIGNVIRFWAWLPNEAMPITPLVSTTDDRLSGGDVFVWVGSEDVFEEGVGPVDAEFRFVHVANTHIPEPSTFTLTALGLAVSLSYGLRGRKLPL